MYTKRTGALYISALAYQNLQAAPQHCKALTQHMLTPPREVIALHDHPPTQNAYERARTKHEKSTTRSHEPAQQRLPPRPSILSLSLHASNLRANLFLTQAACHGPPCPLHPRLLLYINPMHGPVKISRKFIRTQALATLLPSRSTHSPPSQRETIFFEQHVLQNA